MKFSVIILTYNSEATIVNTIERASRVSDDVHVVDSFSSDGTLALVARTRASLVQHEFTNYATQRNWAIDNLPLRYEWELHLDADERLSEELIENLDLLQQHGASPRINGYYVARLVRFLGRPIRHGGMYPIWHMRLFRRGKGRCEEREYDQHFLVDGTTAKLRGPIVDDIRIPLREWVNRHNRWSDAEVFEWRQGSAGRTALQAKVFGGALERKRYFKGCYNQCPLLARAWLLFVYRYIVRLGFLDGKEGIIFFVLQTLWFRFLIDAKVFEEEQKLNDQASEPRRTDNRLVSPPRR